MRLTNKNGLINSFKSAMSNYASQAMILTSGFKNNSNCLHGMTLSSVTSLSILPTPLLQFNLHLPSHTSTSLHSTHYLALHILPPTSNSVKLARIFARGIKRDEELRNEKIQIKIDDTLNNDTLKSSLNDGLKIGSNDGSNDESMTRPFTHLSSNEYTFFDIDNTKIPILSDAEKIIVCKAEQSFNVDNHEIWVVSVKHIIDNGGDTGGLLYWNRKFHQTGKNL